MSELIVPLVVERPSSGSSCFIEKPNEALDASTSAACSQQSIVTGSSQDTNSSSNSNSLRYLIARARIEANNRRHKVPLSTHHHHHNSERLLQWTDVQQFVETSQKQAIHQVADECLRISREVEQDYNNNTAKQQSKKRSPSPLTQQNKMRKLSSSTSSFQVVSDYGLPLVSPVTETPIRRPKRRNPREFFALSRLMCSDSSLNTTTTSSEDDDEDCSSQENSRMELSDLDALALQELQPQQSSSSGLSLDDDESIRSEDLRPSEDSNDDDDDDDSIAFSVDSVRMRKQQIDSQSNLSSRNEAPLPQIEIPREENEMKTLNQAMAVPSWFHLGAKFATDDDDEETWE